MEALSRDFSRIRIIGSSARATLSAKSLTYFPFLPEELVLSLNT
jgi:hypothetical protein